MKGATKPWRAENQPAGRLNGSQRRGRRAGVVRLWRRLYALQEVNVKLTWLMAGSCSDPDVCKMDEFDIDVEACRERQRRLRREMEKLEIEWVIVNQTAHVQWLTGVYYPWLYQPAAAMTADGHLTLVAPQSEPPLAAADDVLTYEAKWHSTLRNDQRQASQEVLLRAIGPRTRGKTVGLEYSSTSLHGSWEPRRQVDVEPLLLQLRRRKGPDELARIRKAIAATGAMYRRARQIIAAGISELEVFSALQAAAVEECGELLTGTGNDYQCGSRGGPPRQGRQAAAGELYILDLGPAFRGYFADNARTIAVSEPTPLQQEAWKYVTRIFDHVEQVVRPGKNARELFCEAQALLDEAPVGVFNHHLGHGIGLFPHEAPHLNPHWSDTFEAGDVFTVEPGLYAPELAAGMRIENNYLVTEQGVELLSDFPLEL